MKKQNKRENQFPISNITFEDWEKGLFHTSYYKFPGDHLITDSDGNSRIDRISQVEFDKIQEAAKNLFWAKVENKLSLLIKDFKKSYKGSNNPIRLFEIEKNKLELELGINEPAIPPQPSPNWFPSHKEQYHIYKVEGKERNYFSTPSENYHEGDTDIHLIDFEAKYKFWEWLKDGIDPPESHRIYLIKDGKQVLSEWDFMEKTGFLKNIKEKFDGTINPVHDYNLLKPVRRQQYEERLKRFIAKRELNHLDTTKFELILCYIDWLNHELKIIEQWISENHPDGSKKSKFEKQSTSNKIEIFKYKNYIEREIKYSNEQITNEKMNTHQPSIAEIALKQFFLWKYENGKAITPTNGMDFFQGMTYTSVRDLFEKFRDYKDDANRLNFNSGDKRPWLRQIKLYEKIIEQLGNSAPKAALEAKRELEIMNKK